MPGRLERLDDLRQKVFAEDGARLGHVRRDGPFWFVYDRSDSDRKPGAFNTAQDAADQMAGDYVTRRSEKRGGKRR